MSGECFTRSVSRFFFMGDCTMADTTKLAGTFVGIRVLIRVKPLVNGLSFAETVESMSPKSLAHPRSGWLEADTNFVLITRRLQEFGFQPRWGGYDKDYKLLIVFTIPESICTHLQALLAEKLGDIPGWGLIEARPVHLICDPPAVAVPS